MKCFTVRTHEVIEGLGWEREPYPHVPIGEEGRGRKLVRFPIGRRFAETLEEENRIERASVLKTKEKGTLLLVEERVDEQERILVHLAVEAGFRGGAGWYVRVEKYPCFKRGSISYFMDKCSFCGVEYVQDKHPDEGETDLVYLDDCEEIKILAHGICAQGMAGRMGNHSEWLIILPKDKVLKVIRSGRLYGDPSEKILLWDGKDLKFDTEDVVFPPTDQREEGELI